MFKWLKKLFTKKASEVLAVEAPKVPVMTINLQDIVKELEAAMQLDVGGRSIPFELAEDYAQVQYEFENIEIESEHWTDKDYLEQLLAYYQQGYKFEGLIELYKKAQSGKDLSPVESDKLKNWYKLVAMELVYDV